MLIVIQPPELGVAGSNPAWVTTLRERGRSLRSCLSVLCVPRWSSHEIQGLAKQRESRTAIVVRSKERARRTAALDHAEPLKPRIWSRLAGAQPPNCVSCASFTLATSTADAFGTTTYAWDAKNRLVEVNGRSGREFRCSKKSGRRWNDRTVSSPVEKAKPFDIPKSVVWNAYLRVRSRTWNRRRVDRAFRRESEGWPQPLRPRT